MAGDQGGTLVTGSQLAGEQVNVRFPFSARSALVGLALLAPGVAFAQRSLTPERQARMERSLERRIVLLEGDLDDEAATVAIAQLLFLESRGTGEIALVIDSPGGSLVAGLALHETVRGLKAQVATWCADRCSGAAAFVLAAGAKGRRHVTPRSRVELQDVVGRDGAPRQAVERQRRKVIELLSGSTGKPPSRIDRDLKAGLALSANQALGYGFADAMAPPPAEP